MDILVSTQDDSLVFANEPRWPENARTEKGQADTSDIFGTPVKQCELTQRDIPITGVYRGPDSFQCDTDVFERSLQSRSIQNVLSHVTKDDSNGNETTIADETILEDQKIEEDIEALHEGLRFQPLMTNKNPLLINTFEKPISQNQDTQIIGHHLKNLASSPRKSVEDLDHFPERDRPFLSASSISGNHTFNVASNATDLINDYQDTQVINKAPVEGLVDTRVVASFSDTYSGPKDTVLSSPNCHTQVIPQKPQMSIDKLRLLLTQDDCAGPTFLGGSLTNTNSIMNSMLSENIESQNVNEVSQQLTLERKNGTSTSDTLILPKKAKLEDFIDSRLISLRETTKILPQNREFEPETLEFQTEIERAAIKSSSCNFNGILSRLQPSFPDEISVYYNEDESQMQHANTSIVETIFGTKNENCLDEATTQVLNTQEDVYHESSLELVDLESEPITSNNDKQVSFNFSDLSIVSVDDDVDSEVEDVTFVHEDSIFNQKKRRLNAKPQEEATMKFKGGYSDMKLSKVTNSFALKERNSLREPVKLKESWSSSSSDHEDISRDPSSVLSNLPFDTSTTAFEGVSQEVHIPPSRRDNGVPDAQSQSEGPILREERLSIICADSIVNSQAVWAFSLFRHLPAIVLSTGEDTSLVLEHLNKEVNVLNSDLHLLDIRVGDFVLVILKFGEYIVTGLARAGNSQFRCVRGYDTVFICKKGRQCVAQGSELQVSLQEICLEADHWASHLLRFQFRSGDEDLLLLTYSVAKRIIGTALQELPLKTANENVQLFVNQSPMTLVPTSNGLFSGAFFFVTSIEGERKDHLQRLITSNGGVIIDEEIDLILERSESYRGVCTLWLESLKGFKFGALLADGYSRSAKYLQALALGWPILADAFVEKSLEKPNLFECWPSFLLPAGISFYLNGTKSHDVFHFRQNYIKGVTMDQQLVNNADLLSSVTVLILGIGQDAKVLRMCGFIFHAFGVKAIVTLGECSSIESYLAQHGADSTLIYDNNNQEFQKLCNKKVKQKSRKKLSKVGVINWEWVVQCVISNLIWKPVVELQI